MHDRLYALEQFGIKLGLDNISRLCDALGHPERHFIALHIAGTNGKGSVTAMVHAALRAAGIAAARYTSPHLSDLRERFVVNDEPVAPDDLTAAIDHVLDHAERMHAAGALQTRPTFFEATTAVAFELFRRAQVTVAVIEVGLGGRFDATNVVEPPVGAITSVAFDHETHLGHTLEAIAYEKAGIIKSGMTVIAGTLPQEAYDVVRRVAHERNAHLISATTDTRVHAAFASGTTSLTVETPDATYGAIPLALRGAHQIGNAVTAIRVLEAVRATGLVVSRDAIERGLTTTRWPARLELITCKDGRAILIDAAHNPHGAHALAAYLRTWHPDRPPLVLGMMRDKDVEGIVRALLPVTSVIVATAADTHRAMPPQMLADHVTAIDPTRRVHVESNIEQALDRAFDGRELVCVAGSIFLAGEVRDVLKGRAILP